MCYFLQLNVSAQGRDEPVRVAVQRLAENAKLVLQGEFPAWQVTDGHCSCDFVPKGRSVTMERFLADLVQLPEVKFLPLGWSWSEPLPADAPTERLSIQEFHERNAAGLLHQDVWYRLYDPGKYPSHIVA